MTISFAIDIFSCRRGPVAGCCLLNFPPTRKARYNKPREPENIGRTHVHGLSCCQFRTERVSFVLFVVGDDFVRHRCGFQPMCVCCWLVRINCSCQNSNELHWNSLYERKTVLFEVPAQWNLCQTVLLRTIESISKSYFKFSAVCAKLFYCSETNRSACP